MNIHLPAILGFTRYQGFDPSLNLANLTSEISAHGHTSSPHIAREAIAPTMHWHQMLLWPQIFSGRPNSGILMHFAILPGKMIIIENPLELEVVYFHLFSIKFKQNSTMRDRLIDAGSCWPTGHCAHRLQLENYALGLLNAIKKGREKMCVQLE